MMLGHLQEVKRVACAVRYRKYVYTNQVDLRFNLVLVILTLISNCTVRYIDLAKIDCYVAAANCMYKIDTIQSRRGHWLAWVIYDFGCLGHKRMKI